MQRILLAVSLGLGFTATAISAEQSELPTVTVYPDPIITMIDRLSRQIINEALPGAELPQLIAPQARAAEPLDAPAKHQDTATLS